MKNLLNLKTSIYQQKNAGSFNGLTVKEGMLINERPDGQTGIAKLAQLKKSVKQAEKISVIARGNAMSEMMEDEDCGCS
jgi:ABC-type uncharacterized transport system ATPase component